nr:Leucine-rich repeat domain containing protein [Haemonchus contortus]
MFTGRLKSEIPPILRSMCSAMINAHCHITELDLSDNAFGPIGAEGISQFLVSKSAYSLQVLKLNNNGLGAGGKTIAESECFVRSVQAKRRLKLKTFIAGRNRLEVPGAVALAEAFTKIGSLEEFAVPQNGITAKGVEALAACFEGNPNLRVINLNDNTATQLGSSAIAKALPSLPRLEVLNLGDCLCRDQGCHAIVDALSPTVHKALKEVDLSGAEMSGAAAMQIVEKWKKFPSTVRLIVSSNNFGGVFEQLRAVVNQNIVLGESDDDQGSLSSDDEEKMSAEETSDDDGLKMEVRENPMFNTNSMLTW